MAPSAIPCWAQHLGCPFGLMLFAHFRLLQASHTQLICYSPIQFLNPPCDHIYRFYPILAVYFAAIGPQEHPIWPIQVLLVALERLASLRLYEQVQSLLHCLEYHLHLLLGR